MTLKEGKESPDREISGRPQVIKTEGKIFDADKVKSDLLHGYRVRRRGDFDLSDTVIVYTQFGDDVFEVIAEFREVESGGLIADESQTFAVTTVTLRRKWNFPAKGVKHATRERRTIEARTRNFSVNGPENVYVVQLSKGGHLNEESFWNRYRQSTPAGEFNRRQFEVAQGEALTFNDRKVRFGDPDRMEVVWMQDEAVPSLPLMQLPSGIE